MMKSVGIDMMKKVDWIGKSGSIKTVGEGEVK